MHPSRWPDHLETDLLAKSADRGEGGKAESLARHTWLVLSRLTDFIYLRPNVPLQLDQPRLWHILYWATFLHDFGKAMPDFQAMLRQDAEAKARWLGQRHEVFSLAFVNWIANGLSPQEREWLAYCIVSHHKDASDIHNAYATPEADSVDPLLKPFTELPDAHIIGLHHWLTECGWQWAIDLGLDQCGVEPIQVSEQPQFPFATDAVQRVRDWLRHYRRFIRKLGRVYDAPQLVPLLTLRGTLINSDHAGSSHRGALPTLAFSADTVLQQIAPHTPYNHQTQSGNALGSALLTAPTGSGKTEAALLWAARQSAEMPVTPRIFYTLPYQASMNAMKLRLNETFGEEMVALQHGRSTLALYNLLIDRDYDPKKAAWHTRQLKDLTRLNYQPVRVFSPYQMLKWMYRIKGYETNLADYHNGLFIFDEIHAYEVKRLALILKSIEYLRRYYHARFFIMSATFPSIIKRWLTQTLDLSQEDSVIATPQLFQQFQRHQIDVIEGDLLDHLYKATADAWSGKSVLIVCNLIARAQTAYEQLQPLRKKGIKVILLHGNFNMRDRDRKEKEIRRYTGAKSPDRCPTVVVATQVVEVSLDIDLNTIYTDPAPLEALVQRFGRINRARKREFAPVHIFTALQDDQDKPIHMIYEQNLLTRTLEILRRENHQRIDEGKVGAWLDEIYAGEIAEQWQQEFEQAAREFDEAVLQTLRPFQSDQWLKETFYKAFDGVDVLPECYWDEYETLLKTNPMEARQLFVSISYGRLHQIRNKRLACTEKGEWPIVVAIPYSTDSGFDLSVLRQ